MKDVALHHARMVIHYREAVFCASYSAGMHEDQSRMTQKAISERCYFYAEHIYPLKYMTKITIVHSHVDLLTLQI